MSYLIYRNDQQEGPFDVNALHEMLTAGQITYETPIWQEGMADWQPLQTLYQTEETQVEAKPDVGVKVEDAVNSAVSKLVTDDQDPAAVQKISKRVSDILTKGEQIDYIGVQKKPVVNIAPDAVVLTNKRIIFARPKLTGFNFEDFRWMQVHDIHLSEQMLGATISCVIVGGQKVALDSIPKKQARKIYSYAQYIEEKMIEERRNRELEEKRAAAGGVVIQPPVGAAPAAAPAGEDLMEQLSKLKQMLNAELIEQAEFESKESEILSRM